MSPEINVSCPLLINPSSWVLKLSKNKSRSLQGYLYTLATIILCRLFRGSSIQQDSMPSAHMPRSRLLKKSNFCEIYRPTPAADDLELVFKNMQPGILILCGLFNFIQFSFRKSNYIRGFFTVNVISCKRDIFLYIKFQR